MKAYIGEPAPLWQREELGFQHVNYLHPPLCEPARPHATGYDIVTNFDPGQYASDPTEIGNAIQHEYDYTKADRPAPPGTPSGIDLTSPHSVNGLMHHVIAHAVTGDVRHGVSNTRVIPYWDREAFIVGLGQIVDDPQELQGRLEIVDALCINVLRTLAHHYVGRLNTPPEFSPDEHEQNAFRIEVAISKGKRSKESPLRDQHAALYVARRALDGDVDHEAIRAMDRMHAIAKIKQLLWLVDQQYNERIRGGLVEELVTLTDRAQEAGITQEELALDMGADTGISSATHRPLYDIRAFTQLRHLGADTYALPQDDCDRIPLSDLLESIDRPGNSFPAYEDTRYRLPFQFGERRIPRQV